MQNLVLPWQRKLSRGVVRPCHQNGLLFIKVLIAKQERMMKTGKTMSESFEIKYNKDTSWTVKSEGGKISRKFWSKQELEDFLDLHENLARISISIPIFG